MSSPSPLVSAWLALQDAYAAERSAARAVANPDRQRQSERAVAGLAQQHDDSLAKLDDALKALALELK